MELYHLEGQSYPDALRGRMALYNRWLHTELWDALYESFPMDLHYRTAEKPTRRMLEFTSVERFGNGAVEDVRFEIETPHESLRAPLAFLELAGWAYSVDNEPMTIEVSHRGIALRSAAAVLERPDVAQAHATPSASNSGFRILIGTFSLPREFGLVISAHRGARVVPLAKISGRKLAGGMDVNSALQPIMLTMQGRVGSTMLMNLLGAHGQIIAAKGSATDPYRTSFASYWLHAFHVMSEPADVANYPPSSVALDSRMTGFNPFYAPPLVDDPGIASVFGAGIPTRILNAVTSNIDDTYLAMARADGKKHAVRFVEKFHPNHLPWLVWTVYPNAKELFLVRDFRDMFCSILSFNKKRGYPAFGREKYGTDEEFLLGLRQAAIDFVRTIELRRDLSHVLRYEDLVASTRTTRETLSYTLNSTTTRQRLRPCFSKLTNRKIGFLNTAQPSLRASQWGGGGRPRCRPGCGRD